MKEMFFLLFPFFPMKNETDANNWKCLERKGCLRNKLERDHFIWPMGLEKRIVSFSKTEKNFKRTYTINGLVLCRPAGGAQQYGKV